MIPQRNLSLLSNRLAREGGRRIPEAVLERDYCLSWFLVGLSRTSLKDILAFKGGTAIKKCYIPEYRFSEDLDFTLREEITFDTIRERPILHIIVYCTWIYPTRNAVCFCSSNPDALWCRSPGSNRDALAGGGF